MSSSPEGGYGIAANWGVEYDDVITLEVWTHCKAQLRHSRPKISGSPSTSTFARTIQFNPLAAHMNYLRLVFDSSLTRGVFPFRKISRVKEASVACEG